MYYFKNEVIKIKIVYIFVVFLTPKILSGISKKWLPITIKEDSLSHVKSCEKDTGTG